MDDILTGPTTVSLGAHTRGRGWLRGREHRLPLPGLSARDSQAENQVPEGPQGPGNHPLLAPQGHDYLLRMPPGGCGQLWRNGQRDSHAISAHAPVLVCRGDRGVVSVGAVSYVFELLDESPRPPEAARRTGPPGWSLGLTASILLHALLAAVAWAISVPPSSHQGPELALLLEERDLEPRLRKVHIRLQPAQPSEARLDHSPSTRRLAYRSPSPLDLSVLRSRDPAPVKVSELATPDTQRGGEAPTSTQTSGPAPEVETGARSAPRPEGQRLASAKPAEVQPPRDSGGPKSGNHGLGPPDGRGAPGTMPLVVTNLEVTAQHIPAAVAHTSLDHAALAPAVLVSPKRAGKETEKGVKPSPIPALDGAKVDTKGQVDGREPLAMSGGDPSILGPMTPADVTRVVRAHRLALHYCFEQGRVRNPGLQGKVIAQWRIDVRGQVQSARIARSSLPSSRVEGCIVRRIRAMRFPGPLTAEVQVAYPFSFGVGS